MKVAPPVPPRPGVSLVPLFARDGGGAHPNLWWLHEGNRALRMGDWKLVALRDKSWELYDLKRDRGEQHNLASKHPEKARELAERWQALEGEFFKLATADQPSSK